MVDFEWYLSICLSSLQRTGKADVSIRLRPKQDNVPQHYQLGWWNLQKSRNLTVKLSTFLWRFSLYCDAKKGCLFREISDGDPFVFGYLRYDMHIWKPGGQFFEWVVFIFHKQFEHIFDIVLWFFRTFTNWVPLYIFGQNPSCFASFFTLRT